MERRTLVLVVVAVVLFLAATSPSLAGGWAVVTLDELPEEVSAGQSLRLGLMIRQHGQTPVFVEEVTLLARNLDTGEQLTAQGVADEALGHYTIEVAFPSEGEWTWEIIPAPFAATRFEPLSVQSAAAATVTAPADAQSPTINTRTLLRGAGLLLLGMAALLFVTRGRAPAAEGVPVQP